VVGWAILWGWVLPQTPLIDVAWATGDLWLRQLPNPQPGPIQVVSFTGKNALIDRPVYAQRVEQLLAAGARGVVLNLPEDFALPLRLPGRLPLDLPSPCFSALQTNLDCPLSLVLARNYPHLVLVTQAAPGARITQVYNHFQSFTEDGEQYRYPLESLLVVQGRDTRFLEPPQVYRDTAAVMRGPLTLATVAGLTTQKWAGVQPLTQTQGVRLSPPGSVPIQDSQAVCAGGCRDVQDKIIVLGPAGELVRTPWGTMDRLEAQAQTIRAALNQDYYRVLSAPCQGSVVLGIGLLWWWFLQYRPWPWFMYGLGVAGWLGITGLALGVGGVLLPVFFGLGALVCIQATHWVMELTGQLEQLRRAERQAILNQARKLLYRVATDIHDQQLQQLKLVMDDLEASLDQPQAQVIDHSLDQLEQIGRGIRNELGNLRSLADKLEISPQLKQGLDQGIRALVDEAQHKGELLLPVRLELASLAEPLTESSWLDAREDIFRFFREAFTNALRHGQGGTYLAISLKRTLEGAELVVENDGAAPFQESGYGTKAMNTISQSLPGGRWEREWLTGGRVRVSLTWTMAKR